MTSRTRHHLLALGFTASAIAAAVVARSAHAFTPGEQVTVSAGVTIGPASEAPNAAPVHIVHVPLIAVSLVDRVAIIQGQAGESPYGYNPVFSARITPGESTAGGPIRVTVFYRFIQPGTPPNADLGDETELAQVLGPDPMGFAFQVPPSSLSLGILQYRILAERLANQAGMQVAVSTDAFPEPIGGITQYVSVGIIADAPAVIGPSGGRVVLHNGNPNVGWSEVDIPSGALADNETVTLNQLQPNDPQIPPLSGIGTPVAVYNLISESPVNAAQVTLLFPDFTFPQGQSGFFNGTSIPVGQGSIVGWDGFSWRRLGGGINTVLNTITTNLGFFKYMAVVPLGEVSGADRRPKQRIITPESNGPNSTVLFALDGGSVEIYNISGHLVRTITSGGNPVWDGRDDSGKVVESGVYIYQFDADGQRISGLIAVAK